jgi:hypothetical protein
LQARALGGGDGADPKMVARLAMSATDPDRLISQRSTSRKKLEMFLFAKKYEGPGFYRTED